MRDNKTKMDYKPAFSGEFELKAAIRYINTNPELKVRIASENRNKSQDILDKELKASLGKENTKGLLPDLIEELCLKLTTQLE